MYVGWSLDPWRQVVADSAGVADSQADESLLSPGASPGVLYGVVGGSEAYQFDVVVQVAAAVVEHAWGVSAPVGGVCWDSDGSALDGVGDVGAAFGCGNAWDLEASTLGLAALSLGSVRIGTLSGDTIILHIGQTLVVETSIAALVSVFGWAVNQLLFREVNCRSLWESPGFQNGHSAEGPAWSAAALVLNFWDPSLGNPVDIGIDGRHIDVKVVFVGVLARRKVDHLEFGIS